MTYGWMVFRMTPHGWVCVMRGATCSVTHPRMERVDNMFLLRGLFSKLPKPGFCKRPHKYLTRTSTTV